ILTTTTDLTRWRELPGGFSALAQNTWMTHRFCDSACETVTLKGITYEDTSLVLPRLPGGAPGARSRSGRSRRREGAVRDRSCGLPGQGGSRNRGVVSAGRTRRGPSARCPCVRLRDRRPDRYAVERPNSRHAEGRADVL